MKAVRPRKKGLARIIGRLLPPGCARPTWAVADRFEYAVGDARNPSMIITVPEGFEFDGASVPMLFWPIFPMAHPAYIQAAALHDFLYSCGGVFEPDEMPWLVATGRTITRREADSIFREALGVLGMAAHWRWSFWAAVRIGGALWWHIKKGKTDG